MKFKGDIIITDPCYIIREESHGTKPLTDDDWETCSYGKNMEALGIHTYLCRDTGVGDWSCRTLNSDTGEPIGEFCADAGLVAVFLLDEVLKYNPDYDDYINLPYTTTWIKGFDGDVEIKVLSEEEAHIEWTSNGYKPFDYVSVVGSGNINFITKIGYFE